MKNKLIQFTKIYHFLLFITIFRAEARLPQFQGTRSNQLLFTNIEIFNTRALDAKFRIESLEKKLTNDTIIFAPSRIFQMLWMIACFRLMISSHNLNGGFELKNNLISRQIPG